MRAISGVLSLLAVLAVVALLAKKQLAAPAAPGAPAAAVSPQQQGEEATQQYKKALESAMQQPRPMPEDQKN